MKKRPAVFIVFIIVILAIALFFLFKSAKISLNSGGFFENPKNYIDAGNVTARFEHYTSVSRHTSKSDILANPLFFNGYEVIIVGQYSEKELYGEKLGTLTDATNNALILAHKPELEQGKTYEITGTVKVVDYQSKNIPVIWVKNATTYSAVNVSSIGKNYLSSIGKNFSE